MNSSNALSAFMKSLTSHHEFEKIDIVVDNSKTPPSFRIADISSLSSSQRSLDTRWESRRELQTSNVPINENNIRLKNPPICPERRISDENQLKQFSIFAPNCPRRRSSVETESFSGNDYHEPFDWKKVLADLDD